MKQRVLIAAIATVFALLGTAQYALGGAVMSVDLGSEGFTVYVVSSGMPMEVALNKESKRKTPATVAFRDGVRVFGEDAVNIGLRFPANSFFHLLDLLGKSVDNPIVKLYQQRFPYYEIEGDPERNTVVFKVGEDKYSIEELIAQLLQKSRDFAEISTGQPISECVLVVPSYFGQAERTALLTSASLANLKVLQLINDHMAVSLNYGIFKRKEFNETAQYFAFYDMGAYKTSASIVSYQLVKDKATRETNPVIHVLGVGYDRTLGGLEMQLRLRDHLAKEFNKLKKTKTDVFTSPRAMAKLFKEAGRVKNVLSANKDHFAQIEGLLDEIDFKHQVTRETFENLCTDLFDRVTKPLERALDASGLTLDLISQVTLFGGGTRVPKIQEVLRAYVKQDLGKNINMDEAAAMGAVYRAADLATGFRVNKFITKDAVLFPIQVTFEREGNSGNPKLVKRSLFTKMGAYPQKKVITFNKNTEDFAFNVNYAELDHLPKHEVENIGNLNLLKIQLKDVGKIINANQGENIESKGIKAHFILDDSGLFSLSGVDSVVEKTVIENEEESSLSKLGNTISALFSSNDDGKVDESAPDSDMDKTTEKIVEDGKVNETSTNTTFPDFEAALNKTVVDNTPKVVTIKEPIPNEVEILYTVHMTPERYEQSRKKVDQLNEMERQILRRETALNALESFVIEAQHKLNEEEYASCATAEESEAVRKACADVSEWLYEDGEHADAETYEKKLFELQEKTNPIFARHWEHNERPEALKALDKLLEGARDFLTNARNFTKEANPDRDVFTPVEISTLENAITETEAWRVAEQAAQDKLNRHDTVTMPISSVTDKMALLDREVKYMVSKLNIWKPKVKEAPKKSKKATNDSQTTDSGDAEVKVDVDEPAAIVDEAEPAAIADDAEPAAIADDAEPVAIADEAEQAEDKPSVPSDTEETITPSKSRDSKKDSHSEL